MPGAGVLLDHLLPFDNCSENIAKGSLVSFSFDWFVFIQAEYVFKGVKLDEQTLFIKLIHSVAIIWAFQRLGLCQMWTK